MSKSRKLSFLNKDSETTNKYENREGLVYVRVSSKRQEIEGSGLQTQENRCIKDLENIGVPYLATFADSFSGGGDFMNRPAMRKMLEYIDANNHKSFVVVFDDLKRFARDAQFHIKLRNMLIGRGVEVRCLNFTFDDSPEGRFAELIMAGQAELERSQNARQVVQKQRARLILGYHPFGAKRGYKQKKFPEHGKLSVRKEPDATYLQEALEGFASGIFQKKIDACKFLVEKGFWKTQKPEKYIDKFSKILKDPFYAGWVEYLDWEVDRREGKHEGLISKEVFNLNQKKLKKTETTRNVRLDINPEFPMRGLIICGCCNGHLTASPSRGRGGKYSYYVCHNKSCELYGKSLTKKDVESRFDKFLKKHKLKKDVSKVVNIIFDKAWKEEIGEVERKFSESKQKTQELNKKIALLTDKVLNAKSEKLADAYERQIEATELEIIAQEEGIESENIDLDIPYRTALEKSTQLLKNPYAVWSKLDVFEKQKLFFFIFDEKIPYHKESGYRTAKKPYAISLFEEFVTTNPQQVGTSLTILNFLITAPKCVDH